MKGLKLATTSEVVIEKGVPLPQGGWGSGNKWPWEKMEVGDSFLFPTTVKDGSARNAAKAAGLKLRRKFVVKSRDGELRCWRAE